MYSACLTVFSVCFPGLPFCCFCLASGGSSRCPHPALYLFGTGQIGDLATTPSPVARLSTRKWRMQTAAGLSAAERLACLQCTSASSRGMLDCLRRGREQSITSLNLMTHVPTLRPLPHNSMASSLWTAEHGDRAVTLILGLNEIRLRRRGNRCRQGTLTFSFFCCHKRSGDKTQEAEKQCQPTAVLPKIPHCNSSKNVPNRPLRGRRGRFGTLLQPLECGIFERTAVHKTQRDGNE